MKNSETLEQVLKYIDANLDKPLSVEGLAFRRATRLITFRACFLGVWASQ